MTARQLRITAFLAIVWVMIAFVVTTAATYAWFTFSPYTNVTPMEGTVVGGGSLMISAERDGKYDVTCELRPYGNGSVLQPLSTADLRSFYSAGAQDAKGITVGYVPGDRAVNSQTLHGIVYLKADGNAQDVYFDREGVSFGSDPQALAAMRLGLRITVAGEASTYIFRLDEMGSTSGAVSRRTVPQSGTVVASIDSSGKPTYVSDPARSILPFFAPRSGEDVTPGEAKLCTLQDGEIADVEYWLYLEGCDDQCIDAVQRRDVALQFAFSGV
ncbi:MAG: hypothetical protein IJT18_05300 [Oscillospiraceae bacterium]|nr:hypothetical protein [Oscillospiraceae bacterium]